MLVVLVKVRVKARVRLRVKVKVRLDVKVRVRARILVIGLDLDFFFLYPTTFGVTNGCGWWVCPSPSPSPCSVRNTPYSYSYSIRNTTILLSFFRFHAPLHVFTSGWLAGSPLTLAVIGRGLGRGRGRVLRGRVIGLAVVFLDDGKAELKVFLDSD